MNSMSEIWTYKGYDDDDDDDDEDEDDDDDDDAEDYEQDIRDLNTQWWCRILWAGCWRTKHTMAKMFDVSSLYFTYRHLCVYYIKLWNVYIAIYFEPTSLPLKLSLQCLSLEDGKYWKI